MKYPLIIKPRNGFSSTDVYCVENAIEMQQILKKVNFPIIQEYLPGKEFTIDVVADDESNILAVVPRDLMLVFHRRSYS